MSVLVFGSINMDLVARSPRLPVPGETLSGYSFETISGGKGANQAVAAAQLGVSTQMIGRVGGDRFGRDLIDSLRSSGVNCDSVFVDSTAASGVAMIAVADSGENQIIIVPGANGRLDAADLDRLQSVLSGASLLLLQLEVPIALAIAAAQAARQAGVTVMLDPAPAQSVPEALYGLVDILTPNQVEAGQLVGFAVDDAESIFTAATMLHQRGVRTVILKLGKQGAFCLNAEGSLAIPAFSVEAIDTVAAGDAFNGGLAAGLVSGLAIDRAVIWGAATAAISVTRSGAQPSLPSKRELEAFLKAHGK